MFTGRTTTTRELLDRAGDSILFTAARPEIIMERGAGMMIWDTDGKPYLDFVGGWAVNGLGHSPAVIAEALARQAWTLVNASPSFYNKPMIEFASLLTALSGFDRVFFASSGAEANEGAIKLARKHGMKNLGGAYEMITAANGFHGRTLATMSATGKRQWASLFSPKVPGFRHARFNDFGSVMQNVNRNTCAVMLELVQGEGGVHPVDAEYLYNVRRLCDENGILLIYDEIQTGLGRTGKMFAFEHYGIEADVMTLGKGIGGGFPLSAMLVKEAFNLFEAGDQGGTYSGQPLAMAVGHAVVSEIADKGLAARAERQGRYIRESLNGIAERCRLRNIRGLGLLIAFDLPEPRAAELVAECLAEGLLINAPNPYTVRLMPPLIVTEEDIDEMIRRLSRALGRRNDSLPFTKN